MGKITQEGKGQNLSISLATRLLNLLNNLKNISNYMGVMARTTNTIREHNYQRKNASVVRSGENELFKTLNKHIEKRLHRVPI